MISRRIFLASLLLLVAACTQQPAAIELDGQNSYGRSTYASLLGSTPTPLYSYAGAASATPAASYVTTSGNVTANAGVQSVGVHDLAALAPAAGQPSFDTTVKSPTSPSPFSVASSSPSPVNLWTHQPHFTMAEKAPDVPAAAPRAARADSAAFIWPVDSKRVISGFGPKSDGKTNDGINIAAGEGEPVWAAADGEVVYVGNELAGYGNMVLIRHAGDKTTAYAHLSRAIVDKYDHVKQGDIIGYVGSTGNVREPQLHFAVRDGRDAVDPMQYLSQSVAAN